VIKSRQIRWVEHIYISTDIGEGRGLYRILLGNLRKRDHFKDPRLR
jgi:hypothetical protein